MASFLDERAGLAGKVALVAGGGGGLGRACALDLARAGVVLALADVDGDALDSTAGEARAAGVAVFEAVLDVRDPGALSALFDSCDERFGRLDVLVNVVEDLSGRLHRRERQRPRRPGAHQLHVGGRRHPAGGAAHGRRGSGGSIVTITSIEAHRAAPGYAVYAAMKAALTHLTRTLAVELGRRASASIAWPPTSSPPPASPGWRGGGSAGQRAAAAGDGTDPGDYLTIPLRRKGEVTDVGNCVLFLASDLSSYITGATLHPDGGALGGVGVDGLARRGLHGPAPAWVLDRLEPPET